MSKDGRMRISPILSSLGLRGSLGYCKASEGCRAAIRL